jgi:hypothetical protein
MIRPEDFNAALLDLSSLLLGEETMHGVLQRIVDLTQSAVPGCTHCGLSLLAAGGDRSGHHCGRDRRNDPAARRVAVHLR